MTKMTSFVVTLVSEDDVIDKVVQAPTPEEAVTIAVGLVEINVLEAEVDEISSLLVDRLYDASPVKDPWGCGFSLDMVLQQVEPQKDTDIPYDTLMLEGKRPSAEWHAARIRYMIKNPSVLYWPVEVGCFATEDMTFMVPEVLDGWHRLFAHKVMKKKTIDAKFSGDLRLLSFLEGNTSYLVE